jgi:hypothetical protein
VSVRVFRLLNNSNGFRCIFGIESTLNIDALGQIPYLIY